MALIETRGMLGSDFLLEKPHAKRGGFVAGALM